MVRWEPDSRGRLEEAALALFRERGFDSTTVAEIAARAGLTERAFFRHYADKREVLFRGTAALQELLVEGVAAAPTTSTPLDAVVAALEKAAALLQDRQEGAVERQGIIDANVELQEREAIKMVRLTSALAQSLGQRGVGEPAASLAAEAGITIFRVSFERWVTGRYKRELPAVMRATYEDLRAVTAGR